MALTKVLSRFISELQYADLPVQAITTCKMAFMDTIGVAIAGLNEEAVNIITEYVLEQGGTKCSSIPGKNFMTNPSLAALLIGTMAHSLDYDDISISMYGHPSVSLIPTILALGDSNNINGQKAIEAYIVGFESLAKTGLFLGRPPYEKGWHYTMTIGVIGAAAAASKILNLPEEKIQMAIGIAATMTGGLKQNFGTMTKPFHAGLASHNGIVAATLANKGFTADPAIIEGLYGLKQVLCEEESVEEEIIIKRIENKEYDIISPGIGFKLYPSCYMGHQSIDAVLYLIHEFDITPEIVKKIRVGVNSLVPKGLIHNLPKTPLEAKFSLEYVMAIALLDRQVSLKQFNESKLRKVKPYLGKVEMYIRGNEDEGIQSYRSLVEIETYDGRTIKKEVIVPKGYPTNPISWDELEKKFIHCMTSKLTKKTTLICRDYIKNLEQIEKFHNLSRLLSV